MSVSRVNSQFGRYRVDALLGRGGMGEVYRAYDTVKERVVALKLLHTMYADDPVYRERFRRESRTAARLGEPHVVPIHDWGEIDGVLFIDMRLVEGEDLRALLTRERRLAPTRAVTLVEQVASALDAAHRDRLIHRDVKPENVLVGSKDFAYLVDFGIANAAGDTRLTQTGGAIGSIAYMAPELFDGQPATPASDVYALACVLVECLTGAVPYPAPSISAAIKAMLTSPPPRPSLSTPGLPVAIDAVVARGLAADPRHRYETAGEMVADARRVLEQRSVRTVEMPPTVVGHPSPTYPPMQPHYTRPGRPSRALPIALGLLTVVLLVGAAVVGTKLFSDDRGNSPTTVAQTPVDDVSTTTEVTAEPELSSETTTYTASSTVRTYPAPTPDIEVSGDPSAPGYVPPPPSVNDAQYFAQFGAFNQLGNAQERAGQHYGSVIVDGSLVGLDSNYAVVRPTNSLAEAQRVCSNFAADACYVQRRVG
ncbi:hypothetical protein nbrc107696_36950 [Gordonia spumicola]|uniref:non-specific serine/threonine protein kinase n=1 Tax=Gordonia spumicola TaxID=589161 RepID=A0A7I9VD20_9ACTN|nr:serine/threonine-protein kinase [Gordonia spumicola]GEE03249.1 hypothetical protein nbrc107696_36950 [Gordonia spumicola]